MTFRTFLRTISFGLSLSMLVAASATMADTSPAQAWLGARRAATVEVNHLYSQIPPSQAAAPTSSAAMDAADQYNQKALADLQAKLQVLLGPIHIKGFPAQGKINLETLNDNDTGFGKLDGLAFTSIDGKTTLVVTSKPLLQAWLREHQQGRNESLPMDIAAAFRNENFYTQAIGNDAAVNKYAELPVTTHAPHTLAAAILFQFAQDYSAPNPPDSIAVSIMQGERVFILTQPAQVNQIATCKTAYDAAVHAINKRHASGVDPYQVPNRDFMHCFAQQFPAQRDHARLVRQAQAMIDSVTE